ncbi:ABC transporter permease [Flavitalea flava]
MLRNYIRAISRNLGRNKGYSVINILGLAAGIAVSLLIFLVIRFETSFDNFHAKKDSIYRVVSIFTTPAGLDYESGVPFPTATALRQDYPQLTRVASILSVGGGGQISPIDGQGKATSKIFKEETGILYAESQFFDIFDFPWMAGDKTTALKDPNTVLLTRSMADKYFGSWQEAMGKSVKLDNTVTYKVTGILKDMPANTDFPLKVVLSYSTLGNTGIRSVLSNWTAIFAQHYCFVVLPANLSADQFNKNLFQLVKKYKPEENRNEGMALLPLKEMHFDTRYNTFNNHPFSKDLILALSLIGLFVLVIACVNFVNLATAQAVNRSKEVGIRKVLGSTHKQLMVRFIGEAAILIVIAALLAVGLCDLSLPYFNHLLDIQIDRAFFTDRNVMGVLVLLILGSILLSGFYPAFVLSSYNPVMAIKNKATMKLSGAAQLRKILVVLQFTIAQTLIIGVMIMLSQMDYFRSAPMGFRKDAIVITHLPENEKDMGKADRLRSLLAQLPGIDKVSFSYASPVDDNNWNSDITYNQVKKNDFGANLKWADTAYPGTYGLKLVAGRFYGQSDTVKDLVVNEAFINKLGIRDPKEAIGAKVGIGDNTSGRISGIVKDFNTASLKDRISPVIMGTWKATYQTVNIKLASSNVPGVLAGIEKIWKASFPGQVYEYRFLDDQIATYYKQEEQLSRLCKIFAGMAIFISCLGLYSLVSFMTVQRAKEVGIRKILGASAANLVYLFSKEFVLLIGIAFCISAPIAGYLMHRWLENYAFHVLPGPGIFLQAFLLSMTIAWFCIGYKAIRTAIANPVKSLRTE